MTSQNKTPTSSSMEEVAAKRPEEVRAPKPKKKPPVGACRDQRATPPQSALRADSSSIEEERGAKLWLHRRAKQLRAQMTPEEKAIWRLLHQGELVALNWRRQAAFGDYIVDFVSHAVRLVLEVDGSQHAEDKQIEHDGLRTRWLASQGYRVLRIWNVDARDAQDGVWRTIYAAAAETPAAARMTRWRESHRRDVEASNARLPLDGGGAREAGGGGARARVVKKAPPEASPQDSRASPPQSSLRDDSSPIEGERGARGGETE